MKTRYIKLRKEVKNFKRRSTNVPPIMGNKSERGVLREGEVEGSKEIERGGILSLSYSRGRSLRTNFIVPVCRRRRRPETVARGGADV